MAGRHLLIDFYDVPFDLLNHAGVIEKTLLHAAKISNATILHHSFHKFAPQGVSGVIVIAESHISIHTWPEEGYAALDIFTCGETMQPDLALNFMKAVFAPKHAQIHQVKRGEHMNTSIKPTLEQTLLEPEPLVKSPLIAADISFRSST